MPLVAAKIQKDMEAAIFAALETAFALSDTSDPSSHIKMATAIATGVTTVLIKALLTDAEVSPGIPTAGSPASQTSVGPGKIT